MTWCWSRPWASGQSETVVAGMVDLFLALMLPGAGDELQGIKKGLLEIADLIAVNKADGDNLLRAQQAVAPLPAALRIIEPESPSWRPPVLTVSALTGDGPAGAVGGDRAASRGARGHRRAGREAPAPAGAWMWSMLERVLLPRFARTPAFERCCRVSSVP